jgi:endoglucanase
MMKKESVDFLSELVDIPSPSGHEWAIQDILRQRMTPYCKEVRTDVHGNVIGVVNPQAPLRVMLSGHCDEIGFMIMHIDDKGFLAFSAVGGIDPSVICGHRVKIYGSKEPVNGVIGRKPIHLMEPEERGKTTKIHDLWIDIGAKNKADAEKVVGIGDYAVLDVGLIHLRNQLVAGRGFDDRAGAFVVVETLRKLKGRDLNVAVYGVTSVQEEIGLRGARTSAYGIDPHAGIAIDVHFATDMPGGEPKRVCECTLGKGPTLHRGPNINPVMERLLRATATAKKIPHQIIASPNATGTDANAIQVSRAGVAAALVSIPNRYMHTSVEMISLDDLENTSTLLAEFLCSLSATQSFVPTAQGRTKRL